MKIFAILALTCTLAVSGTLSAAGARAAPPAEAVGMVLDVRGGGEVSGGGAPARLRLLGYVKPGDRITLAADAKASVSHYGAKLIYQLTGPLVADVDLAKIKVRKGGREPVIRSVAEKLVAAALDPQMSAAAVRMRRFDDIEMLAPAKRGVLLTTRPEFRWEADGDNNYQVSVDELPERELARGTTTDKRWQLPAGVALEHGKSYRWTVAYTAAGGAPASASAVFGVASAADSAGMLALRPEPGAGIEEWVMYATILDERRMHDDAGAAWTIIGAQRPDLAAARATPH
ncbi:hypothetical protein [Massilia glaciei]|uniref:DUF4198 domain-containing protein n=1 Tax=Massilia glaciei TaxID=1524097 RepID=A0A2U2HNC7_9BURK|nr:hypothetical protein [Massilia glaciei]PWF49007.1 hypothetical protein C7C56_008960 [Massilia glaciei]